MTRLPNACTAMAKLTKGQYIEFLKFCKENSLTKSECTRNALIQFCKFSAPTTDEIQRRTIDEELEELVK